MAQIINVPVCQGEQQVFLATPSLEGKVCQAYVASLAASIALLKDAGIGVTYCLQAGNCHVDDSRNGLVREFMLSDCTDLIFLDADIGWRPQDLLTLCEHDVPIVGGVYPKKTDEIEFPVHVIPGTVLQANDAGLVEVYSLPTGFLRIKRDVIDTLYQTHGQRRFRGQGQSENDPPFVILFERTYENGHRWSGDYAFCRKWAETGGKLFCDPRFYFIHAGSKEWSGCLGDYWRDTHGITRKIEQSKFDEAIKAIRNKSETTEHLINLVEGWNNNWSIQPEILDSIIQISREIKGPILELGSGLSTLILGIVTKQPVISLENSPIWATYVKSMLDKYFAYDVDLRCIPLQDYGDFEWYSVNNNFPDFSLVICDGPPRTVKGARSGLKKVYPFIKNAIIILDDPSIEMLDDLNKSLNMEFTMFGKSKPYAIGRKIQ
jgi:hypothetical protein